MDARGIRLIAVLAAAALMAGGSVAAARAAGARPRDTGPAAVVHRISAAAQRSALAYWTPARMAAAATAASMATARSGARPSVSPPPKGIPTAVHFNGVPTTGALFSSAGGQDHFCTADVVNSTAGDLVITAAHCVDGNGFATNIDYVPEYNNGHAPYGLWAVQSITVAAGWQKSHDPDLDVAFLTVGQAGGTRIQAVTGGLTLGFTLHYKQTIEVIGYNDTDTKPVRCLTKSFRFRDGQMEFYCHGFWTGTSGGPWIIGYNARTGAGTVFGGIGGYQEGGQYEWASYSPYFGSAVRTLFGQAERQQTPAPAPSPSLTATPTPAPSATPVPAPTPTVTPSGLQDLRAVHLAERVGEQSQPGAVRVAQVQRRPTLLLVGNPRGVEPAPQVLPLLPGDRDRDVVQATEDLGVRADVQAGEVEERQQVAVPHVEEEVAGPLVVPVLDDLGEREPQDALVEPDRPLNVGADQRRVMDAPRRGRRPGRRDVLALQPGTLGGNRCQVDVSHGTSAVVVGRLP